MAISKRDHALDGLRGLAALVVVIHHSLLTTQLFAQPYFDQRADPAIGWFVYSPLHIVWAGGEAVYVFFILSGLVLTLPVLRRSGGFDWIAYYPSRLIRLYIPVWASVIFAALVVARFPRSSDAGSDWMMGHQPSVTLTTIARDLSLVTGASTINSALWSLQWEVLFSLLLPFYVWAAVKLARFWPILIAASLLAITVGVGTRIGALQFLPMFMIGVVIATRLSQIRSLGERIQDDPSPGGCGPLLQCFRGSL